MKKSILFYLLLLSINVNGQTTIHIPLDLLIKNIGLEKGSKDVQSLVDIDLKIIQFFPTFSDYKNIDVRLKSVPKEYIRYIDSLDYFLLKKDTLVVKLYSQDYAYQSKNSYKLAITQTDKKNNLTLFNLYYDIKIKPKIEDFEIFEKHQFDFTIIKKHILGKRKIERIIISKRDLY